MSKDELIAKLKDSNVALKDSNVSLKQENAMLKKLIFGARSEKHKPTQVDDNQLNMFAHLDENEEQDQEVLTTEVKGYKKIKKVHPGRQPLPDHLPVEEIIIEPEVDTTGMKKIGELITETLEFTPASLKRIRYIRPKYTNQDGNGIVIGALPDRPLPKAIAESGLLSYIITSKFVDHLPFYRQIERFKRDYKITIPSSTLNDWFAATCSLMEPLYNKLKEEVFDTPYLQCDESPIKVMDKNKTGKTHQGYQWVYHNPRLKLILFDYRKGRGMHGPKELLSDFQGTVQCDGYSVYDKVARKNKNIILAGCLAHVRRKYVEAKNSDHLLATVALDLFSEIYKHEKAAKATNDRQQYRNEHIVPLMKQLRVWIDNESIKVLPKSPIGKAMTYTINQWDKLMNIFTSSDIELDNNLIENKIRPLALGRKNYLFAGSHKGAQRIAMMYSFFASCKANEVNPYEWLKSTLEKLPNQSMQNLKDLLPGD